MEIKAGTPAGILNGVQTLRQIIKEKNGKYMIQKTSVSDYPAFYGVPLCWMKDVTLKEERCCTETFG